MKRTVREYPIYQKTDRALFVFLGPMDMYKIEARGSNKNEGLCIDHYITRKMVLHHMSGPECDIEWGEFRQFYDRLFIAARTKMIGF